VITDFSPEEIAEATGVSATAVPGSVVLSVAEPRTMVEVIQLIGGTTPQENIWDVEDLNGYLHITAARDPHNQNGGGAWRYDWRTHSAILQAEPQDQGIYRIVKHNRRLYVQGPDAYAPWCEFGNFYVYDGFAWIWKPTLKWVVHAFDCTEWRNKLYVGTSDGEFPEGSCNSVYGPAYVYETSDEGDTWDPVLRLEQWGPDNNIHYRRIYALGSDDDYLYAYDDQKDPMDKTTLWRYDGMTWEQLILSETTQGSVTGDFYTIGGTTYFNTGSHLYALTDPIQHFTLSFYPGPMWLQWGGYLAHADDGKVYMASTAEMAIYSSTDGVNFQHEIDVPVSDPVNNQISGVHRFMGRLWCGRGPDAEIFAEAVNNDGYIVSEAIDLGVPASWVSLELDAVLPGGITTGRMQVRTAETMAALASAPFVGDGGNPSASLTPGELLAAPPGHWWLQFRYEMHTSNDGVTPLLSEVRIDSLYEPPSSVGNFLLYY
jgi:hypothetical protein